MIKFDRGWHHATPGFIFVVCFQRFYIFLHRSKKLQFRTFTHQFSFKMKNKLLLPAAICLFFVACNQHEKPAPPPPPAEPAAPAVPKAKFAVNCFEQRFPDGSVLSFQYTEYYNDVVGILDYTFAEKDGAHGTFKGKKKDNLITATWSYTVEGSNQTEEILIKIEGDKATKAFGELKEGKGGALSLKDPAAVTWAETFTRVQCD